MRVTGVYTNTLPIDAYRGVAEAQITVGERLVEKRPAKSASTRPSPRYRRTTPTPIRWAPSAIRVTAAQQEALLRAADYPALRDGPVTGERGPWRLGIA